MKKLISLIPMIGLTLLATIPLVYGKGLEVKKQGEGYEFLINIDRNPPIVGDNHMEIEIRDAGGISVPDAEVQVNYYMPPMPRMAPMNYTEKAKWSGEKYKATLNLIMAGPWILRVIVNHNGKRMVARIQVDAQ
jgi:hypothetical protein